MPEEKERVINISKIKQQIIALYNILANNILDFAENIKIYADNEYHLHEDMVELAADKSTTFSDWKRIAGLAYAEYSSTVTVLNRHPQEVVEYLAHIMCHEYTMEDEIQREQQKDNEYEISKLQLTEKMHGVKKGEIPVITSTQADKKGKSLLADILTLSNEIDDIKEKNKDNKAYDRAMKIIE